MKAFIILALCALASGSASASALKGQTLMADGFKGQAVAQTLQAPLQTTIQTALPASQVLYSAAAPAVNYIRSAPLYHRALAYEMPAIRTHAIYRSAPLAVSYEAPIIEARPVASWQSSVRTFQEPIRALAQETDAFKGQSYAEAVKSMPAAQVVAAQEPIKSFQAAKL